MKTKIEIKSKTGDLLFEYEDDDNKLKKTDGIEVKRLTNFQGMDFRGVNFRDADLQNADFQGANFKGAKLHGVNLKDADFQKAE